MKRIAKILTITVIVAVIAVGFVGCDPEIQTEHHYIGYIYAFEQTIKVEGYKNMNAGDFKTAVEKLGEALGALDSATVSILDVRAEVKKMLGHKIEIRVGNDAPAVAEVNGEKILAIGVGYLLETDDAETIGGAIYVLRLSFE